MGLMWFGTRDYATWIQCPAVNVGASKVGWETQSNYLNGGAYVRRSTSAHKEYDLTWNLTSRENIRVITDFADGLYGSGSLYWNDPFANDANLLPQSWAAPMQALDDGLILNGTETRPTATPTPANILGYPVRSVTYTMGAGDKPEVWIPIPVGYTAWVGAHGIDGTGGKVVVTPTTGPTSVGTAGNLTVLSVADYTRVNYSVDSSGGANTGILLSLGGIGTVTLSGIIVQVLPTGSVPATGGFISGQGHSGCSFASQPVLTQYSAALDKVGLTAKMIEVEQWR